MLNLITPIMRRFDSLLPIPPLSLIAVMGLPEATRQDAAASVRSACPATGRPRVRRPTAPRPG